MRLQDKVAVITGATSGFGLAIAQKFSNEGAALILNGRRKELGERIAADLRAAGTDASFVAGDVGDPATGEMIAQHALDRHGRIDVLVLNAGVDPTSIAPFWEVTIDDFDELFATNVRGVWLCARAAVPLLSRGASVVVMASMSSHIVFPGEAPYSASKGAVLQLARGMAGDLAERGVRVNALCPGICDTPMIRSFIEAADDPAACEKEFDRASPLGRMGTSAEVALATLHLASDESSYTTGASLVCDGGIMIR